MFSSLRLQNENHNRATRIVMTFIAFAIFIGINTGFYKLFALINLGPVEGSVDSHDLLTLDRSVCKTMTNGTQACLDGSVAGFTTQGGASTFAQLPDLCDAPNIANPNVTLINACWGWFDGATYATVRNVFLDQYPSAVTSMAALMSLITSTLFIAAMHFRHKLASFFEAASSLIARSTTRSSLPSWANVMLGFVAFAAIYFSFSGIAKAILSSFVSQSSGYNNLTMCWLFGPQEMNDICLAGVQCGSEVNQDKTSYDTNFDDITEYCDPKTQEPSLQNIYWAAETQGQVLALFWALADPDFFGTAACSMLYFLLMEAVVVASVKWPDTRFANFFGNKSSADERARVAADDPSRVTIGGLPGGAYKALGNGAGQ